MRLHKNTQLDAKEKPRKGDAEYPGRLGNLTFLNNKQYGLYLLGLGSRYWKVTDSIAFTPKGYAIACLDKTFGPVLPNLKKMLATKKYPKAEIILYWNNHIGLCPNDVIKSRCPVFEKLAKKYPKVQFYISHTLEHKSSNVKLLKQKMRLIRKYAPSCIPVNNPVMGGAKIPGEINETHNITAPPSGDNTIISNDGTEPSTFNISEYSCKHKNACICFLWYQGFNLTKGLKPGDPKPPPKLRKDIPNPMYVKAIVDFMGLGC